MVLWEYQVVNTLHVQESPEELAAFLNSVGVQGWELVDMRFSYCVFKRPLTDEKGKLLSWPE